MKTPPVSTLERTYETVDARCAACCIKGGPEGMCVDWPIELQRRLERPCPRVELDPDLGAEAELLGFVLHEDLRPLAAAKFEALAESLELTATERDLVLSRVRHVLADHGIIARLHPPISAAPPEKPRA